MAGPCGPAGGRHRELGPVGGRHDHGVGRVAGRRRLQAVDALRERRRARALDLGDAAVVRLGCLADADDLRVARLLGPRRRQLLQRLGAGSRQLAAVREQDGCAQGRRHQLGGGDRGAPVALLDDHDGLRAALVGARRVHRARDARGIGHRVGSDDARGVLGGEDREAERRGLLGLLLVPAGAEHGLAAAPLAAVRFVVPTPAAADQEREQEEGEQPSNHRAKASRYPVAPAALKFS
jgi:hypothetical protein